jgi:hypothetical protein
MAHRQTARAKRGRPSRRTAFLAAMKACEDRYGRLAPGNVVTEARDPQHHLHKDFDWDDASCAHTKRLEVAAALIRRYRFEVVYNDVKLAAPIYIHDPGSSESQYVHTVRIAKNHTKARRALEDELARIRGAIRRAMALSAVFGLVSTFQRMLDTAEEAERALFRTSGDDRERKRKSGGHRLAS